MIYELALVAHAGATEDQQTALKNLVAEVAKNYEGEVLLTDDWGMRSFAQTAKNGSKTGNYIYFIVSGNKDLNTELQRRFKINEDVHKYLIIKLADNNEAAEAVVKGYKTPFSKAHPGSQTDELEKGAEKDKRRFAKRKNCWFKANNITADWKDPKTYNWLINEFGKIQPSRVTGVSTKHHRWAQSAIKRARNIGLVSHVRGDFAH
ncbi:30S ribosomal protein S18 [Halobacteriovorax sp. GFR7]|uniref:30S ribosomal protein S18 n=1 Tax=unclassified Halobacteriovorax TaxID=2639665 RepID=UPI003D99B59E